MKKHIIKLLSIGILLGAVSCNSFLDINPLDKVSKDNLVANEDGIKALLANVYQRLPMEDFNFVLGQGYNYRTYMGGTNSNYIGMMTEEMVKSSGYWGTRVPDYWPYGDIRQVNLFVQTVQEAVEKGTISGDSAKRLIAEADFVKAYMYFEMAKRYGGVPLIDKEQDSEYDPSNPDALKVPRSTEKETWQFIITKCEEAAANLPATSSDEFRATKGAAYALEARAALFAASVAKYWNEAPLSGEAVTKDLAHMSASDANTFYKTCIDACDKVFALGKYALYEPAPADPAAAAKNYQQLFRSIATSEYIFGRGYVDNSNYSGRNQGHSFAQFGVLPQWDPGCLYFGRYNPTLDIVDLFEDYTDNGQGASAPIVTKASGPEVVVEHFGNPNYPADLTALNLKQYDNYAEAFANKDARLHASVILPGSQFSGKDVVIQGGMIRANGGSVIYSNDAEVKGGVTYYALGAQTSAGFSAFANIGNGENGNWSTSGFGLRKWMPEGETIKSGDLTSSFPYIDMRLAEVYLNYAEAVAESNQGDAGKAKGYLNAIRKRAGHKDEIPLTVANVMKERRVEMVFEGQRYWDLIRRREAHKVFNHTLRQALVPIIDLRGAEPKYSFVRAYQMPEENSGGRTFQPIDYYGGVPNASNDGQINNPGR